MKTIYLDHAAATPLRTEVFEAMLPHLRETYGNPSSLHHKGRRAHDVLERARQVVANVLKVTPSSITFTGSGTEANNLAVVGAVRALPAHRHHVLVSSIEHHSVLAAAALLARGGYEVEYVPVDAHGRVRVEDIVARAREDTALISVMYANNEIGTVEPVSALARALREKYAHKERPLLHTDACQGAGQLPLFPTLLGVDLMTLNGSKIYGPKGIGMLYVRDGVHIAPQIVGGGQEAGRRAGTEHVANCVGFATALTLAEEERKTTHERLTYLRDTFIEDIERTFPEAILNGHRSERLPNNIHISFPYIEGESLILLLDTYGICASTGSACSTHDLAPSHVLRAIGQTPELIHGSLRLTLGRTTTEADLKLTLAALRTSVTRLLSLSPLPLTI